MVIEPGPQRLAPVPVGAVGIAFTVATTNVREADLQPVVVFLDSA